MPTPTQIIKATIIYRTVKEDQRAVAEQWWHTFQHNPKEDIGTNMSKLMLACIAQGDFKTKSPLLENSALDNPSPVLTSIDYLSHASRVIFDYKSLSAAHQQEFLASFPKAGDRGITARSATHAVARQGDKITELKGFFYGVLGQMPSWLKTACDFGVNIAMGGDGQFNYIGKTIANNGFSGHMYFHHHLPYQLVMAGLEQSAPASGLDALWGHSTVSSDVQTEADQFDQGHSFTGASDTFTAAGSLYFSDPVYQIKLLTEMGTVTPDKYNGMLVTLTDDNWPLIKSYLLALEENIQQNRVEQVMEQLLTPPSTARKELPVVQSYIAFDFKSYLRRVTLLLDAQELTPQQMGAHVALQDTLLSCIQQLRQDGYNSVIYSQLSSIITQICGLEATPQHYQTAISRIDSLFQLQRSMDPELQKAHLSILIQQHCNEVLEEIKELQEKANRTKLYFLSEHISKENGVGEYLAGLADQIQLLDNIRLALTQGASLDEIDSLEKSMALQETLDTSWTTANPIDLNTLNSYFETVKSFKEFLHNTPRLVSETLLDKMKGCHKELELALMRQEELFQMQQAKQAELEDALSRSSQRAKKQSQRLAQQKVDITLLRQQLEVLLHTRSTAAQAKQTLVQNLQHDLMDLEASVSSKQEQVTQQPAKQAGLDDALSSSSQLVEEQSQRLIQQKSEITLLRQRLKALLQTRSTAVKAKQTLVQTLQHDLKSLEASVSFEEEQVTQQPAKQAELEDALLKQEREITLLREQLDESSRSKEAAEQALALRLQHELNTLQTAVPSAEENPTQQQLKNR